MNMAKKFENGIIDGVMVKDLKKFLDHRGWLCELFRRDEIEEEIFPEMAYCSLTYPGIVRGPHAHREQTDLFYFMGPGNFEVRLWDNREDSPTFGVVQVIFAGQDSPKLVVVPPGVVHGYKVIGTGPGLVFNSPNKLYAGEGKTAPVDEIRYEDQADTPFKFE